MEGILIARVDQKDKDLLEQIAIEESSQEKKKTVSDVVREMVKRRIKQYKRKK